MHGNIKTSHTGGDAKRHPTSGNTHKMQMPGDASKNTCSHMSWKGKEKGYKQFAMLDPHHLRQYIVAPTLHAINLHSQEAEDLLCGTSLAESGLTYLVQVPGGLAKGLWQMEPGTYSFLLSYLKERNPKLYTLICNWLCVKQIPADVSYIIGNLYAGCALARIRYYIDPNPIPATLAGQAKYWSEVYQTTDNIEQQARYVSAYSAAYHTDLTV